MLCLSGFELYSHWVPLVQVLELGIDLLASAYQYLGSGAGPIDVTGDIFS